MWLAACISAAASAVLSALAAAIPANVIGHRPTEFFQACADMLSDDAAVAEAFPRAFSRLPLFARARSSIARLIELLADVAARRHPCIHIAAALVQPATGRASFLLGAGGETALTRVKRMLSPAVPLGCRERIAGLAAVALLLAGPVVVAAIPGLGSFLAHRCHGISIF
ncbi:hypothetical protein ACQPYK_02610 [Streptosporangium sp. CA-135522]|uniref:hypothetical protein n=1 Tax=Streptosporangium sp. CA-135522 TaxID=3240072 RepID=UPI003D8EC6DC